MFQPRYYQREAEWSIFNYFAAGNTGNPVLALPTGTGKSVIIANFIVTTMRNWPNQRILMLTHVKELIQQNAETLKKVWEEVPLGIHSAGLNDRDILMPIIYGGVQSVAKTIKKLKTSDNEILAKHFGHRDILIIDEAHLLSQKEDSMYQYVIANLMTINPNLKIIGFTATPYRLKQGMITDDGIFTDICYDITRYNDFNRLIAEGYLAPLIPKKTNIEIDTSNVKLVAGEFDKKELQKVVDKHEIIFEAVKESIYLGRDRNCWLVFATGIENCEHVAAMFQYFGVDALSSHSKLSDEENAKRLQAFKNGEIKALVNANKLTTGFDHPPIDMIVMLRPTMSPVLWIQMLGRATRPYDGSNDKFPYVKENCLVLDFAGNTKRLGPINDPVKPKKHTAKGTPGDAPIRICPHCGVYNHASVRFCINCGQEFVFETKLFKTSSTDELIRTDSSIVELFEVNKVLYNLHIKRDSEGVVQSPPSIRVSYFCGLQKFDEWICLEHPGVVAKKARDWWRERHNEEPPLTTHLALQRVNELKVPKLIKVWTNKRFPEVIGYEW